MNVLFSFDSIIDTNIGVIKTIRHLFNDDTIFYMDKLNKMDKDPQYMAKNIYYRNDTNPLLLILRPDYTDKADIIYNELFEGYHNKILELSTASPIQTFLSTCIMNSSNTPIVMCNNSNEEKFIKSKYSVNTCILKDKLDVTDYGSIYINKYEDTLKFDNLIAKNIYIFYAKYNLEKDLRTPTIDVSLKINNANKINIMNIYYLKRPK